VSAGTLCQAHRAPETWENKAAWFPAEHSSTCIRIYGCVRVSWLKRTALSENRRSLVAERPAQRPIRISSRTDVPTLAGRSFRLPFEVAESGDFEMAKRRETDASPTRAPSKSGTVPPKSTRKTARGLDRRPLFLLGAGHGAVIFASSTLVLWFLTNSHGGMVGPESHNDCSECRGLLASHRPNAQASFTWKAVFLCSVPLTFSRKRLKV